jgi:aminopeptidase N
VQLRVEDEGDPIGTDAQGARALLALGTLARWTGQPVFDAILTEFVRSSAGRAPSLDDFEHVASRVSGQDLAWFFDAALKTSAGIDFGLAAFDSAPEADGRFHTTVTVRREGDLVFHRGIPVLTTFANGDTVRDVLDGSSRTQTFEYRSPSPAVSAEVDPDRVVLLDRNRRNNGLTLDPAPARSAATRWSARWMIWLEDSLLTYVALT